jgi:hypothetical protein
MVTYEYGAMSSKFSLKAEHKLTAYAVMVIHYQSNAFALIIYEPEECKADAWTSFDGKISARLDEIFGGKGSFDKYFEDNTAKIKDCYKTIKKLV